MLGFSTHVAGIPCRCVVRTHTPRIKPRVFGYAFEDFDPGERGEITLEILDRKGYKAPWLARKLTEADMERLEEEAQAAYMADRYDISF